ncbi:MAG: aminodeoxychorismate synthase component I [Chthoniobacterales bacterium]
MNTCIFVTPLQLAESLHHKKGFVWLDSLVPEVAPKPVQQGLSILAAEPDLILEGGPHEWALLDEELKKRMQAVVCSPEENCFTSTSTSNFNSSSNFAIQNGEIRTSGAAIGYFRYDGSFHFGFYEKTYRHLATTTHSDWLTPLPIIPPSPQKEVVCEPLAFESNLIAQEYCEKVRLAQEEIAAGNIYQVCLAHRFTAPFQGDPWALYLKLRRKNPAPFAAYVQLDQESILSSSPECFLKIDSDQISTYPIKGTQPRGKTAEEDTRQQWQLQHSSKENAELLMITDLERNDLSQICDYGSVTTPNLLELKSYPHVFHLVSKIQGTLRKSISPVEAVAACFPGGSISGVPKKKALEIIQKLEPVPRGLFTGAIGYFSFDGTSQFNIAIRTMVIDHGTATFHVGAGITSDSIPEKEWEETLHKAAGILAAAS